MSFDPIDHDFERGLQNRRNVLGDAWVDRSLDKATGFNADFQNLITRFAWNEIWGRPGLDHKTRRAIVLSITIALGRWEEFELHVRAALLGDEGSRLTPDEIKEILMQSAIYAGVPAANTAFTHTLAILREVGEQIGYSLEPAAPADASHSGIVRGLGCGFCGGVAGGFHVIFRPCPGLSPRRWRRRQPGRPREKPRQNCWGKPCAFQ